MRILLVEPWMTGSHLAWACGYQANSRHEVDIVGLPGELWRWRLRGGALPLADQVTNWVGRHGQPDLVLVSGLVDVAELLGLARRALSADVAVVVYQHESQLVYPVADGMYDQGAALRNWMSWCAADLVLFNSYYHLRAVAEALPGFVTNLPDKTHLPKLDEIVSKFEVFPVGVDLDQILDDVPGAPHGGRDRFTEPSAGLDAVVEIGGGDRIDLGGAGRARVGRSGSGPPVILWPHRWERDKDPAAFLSALDKVVASGLEFRLVLVGQDPPSGSANASAERSEAVKRFGSWTLATGELNRHDYLAALRRCDLVVSCARHEFFGVAVVEAIASGCVPLLPDDLSYPELIRPPWHAPVLYEPGTFGTRLVDAVARIDELREETEGLAQSMRRFGWTSIGPVYDDRFEAVVDRLGTVSTPASL